MLTENQIEFAQSLNIHPALINEHFSSDQIFSQWFKRQNAFQINEIIDRITSGLIDIGRVDLAYEMKRDYLTMNN